MKGVTMMRKLEDSGAELGIVCLVATERAGMFSGILTEHTVAIFSILSEAALPTVTIGAWGVWGSRSHE